MRINNNLMAMNAHRQYSINNNKVSSSVEKLSSGYRINRAGDDAAGLAISEKMRAQIRGLTMASKNSQDAVSLVQTAEGALQSTHDILQRMRELAVQSASDTNETTIDRGAIQQEFEALQAEINDIAAKTRFNDQNLIDGTFSKYQVKLDGDAAGVTIGSGLATRVTATGKAYGTFELTVTGKDYSGTTTSTGTQAASTFAAGGSSSNSVVTAAALTEKFTSKFNGNTYTMQIDDQGSDKFIFRIVDSTGSTVATSDEIDMTAWANATGAAVTQTVNFDGFGSVDFTVADGATAVTAKAELLGSYYNGSTFEFDGTGEDPVVTDATQASASITLNGETMDVKLGDTSVTFRNSGITIYFDGGLRDSDLGASGTLVDDLDGTEVEVSALLGNALTVQVGANQGDEISINIDKMNTVSLGVDGSNVASRLSATKAITEVNDAINSVSTQRAALGALQNRLEFKIANLDTSAENLQSAESRIRDLDMASEMTNFTKNNILSQAATAMLAQANSLPQNVLQLLQ